MKFLPKFSRTLVSLSAVSTLLVAGFGHASATTGQITTAYKIQNLTTGAAYANPASASACDELEYRLRLWNPGAGNLSNVMVEVSLPTNASTSNTSTVNVTATNADPVSASDQATVNLASAQSISYEPGTAQLLDSNTNVISSLPDSIMNYQGGASIGNLNASQLEFVQFKAKVNCPSPPPTPVYSCDLLNITLGDNRTVTITTFNTTAQNGATYSSADINWGDNSSDNGETNVVGKQHQYTQDGTYVVATTAHFSVNGTDKTATSPACQKQITFSSTTPPIVSPPTSTVTTPSTPVTPASSPSTLVNTGTGSTIGLFSVATLLGAGAYRWNLSRRLSRQ